MKPIKCKICERGIKPKHSHIEVAEIMPFKKEVPYQNQRKVLACYHTHCIYLKDFKMKKDM